MGYERNDRRYGGGYAGDRGYGHGRDEDRRSYGSYGGAGRRDYRGDRFNEDGRRDYGRDPRDYDYQDRGFFDRAGDEVRSWFGDEDAERRRRADERYDERNYGDRWRSRGDGGGYAGSYGSGGYSAGYFAGSGGGDFGGGYSPSDYGAGRGAGATSSWGLGAGHDRHDWGADAGYRSWRDRQMQAFDQDYDDYRREHQQKFDRDFHSWRQTRQGQREALGKVQEHQEVVGSDGEHLGTVDHVRGDRILLTKGDKDARGHHHSIPCSWIESVEDKVRIAKTADQARQHWRDEERGGALFGGSNGGGERTWPRSEVTSEAGR